MCRLLFLISMCLFITTSANGLICLGSRKGSSCVSFEQRFRELFYNTVCYAKVGCFNSGPPFFHPLYRPLTLPPQSPETIMPRFMLHTRRNRYRPIFLYDGDVQTLRKSTFNPRAPIRIIIHGYVDVQVITTWFNRMRDAFLDAGDDNVIYFNWSGGNGLSYTVATANTRVAGVLLANFINFLCVETGTAPEQFHVTGHSLGAQIAGYAGQRIRNLGRITGLDPAGPFFSYMPPEVTLDPSDALFVDSIHSNRGEEIVDGFGTPLDVGDMDFWPWDGETPILYCVNRFINTIVDQNPPFESFFNTFGCRHLASTEYFVHSFNQSNCLFVGVKCKSWKDFIAGNCDCGDRGERCSIMGYFAQPSPPEEKLDDLRYYLKTSLHRPHCVHQYRLKITVRNFHRGKRKEQEDYVAAILLIGQESDLQTQIYLKINPRSSEQVLNFLLTSEKLLGNIDMAAMKFENINLIPNQDAQWYNRSQFSLDNIEVAYLYPLPKTQTTFLVCRNPECAQGGCEKMLFKKDFCHL